MNWLAHALLSEPDIEFRLGNLLADLIKKRDRAGLSEAFRRGADRHQRIDAFTDYHPVVGRSRARLAAEWGRVSGILIDIFYDHFLANEWARYCPTPLDEFTAELYAGIRALPLSLAPEAEQAVRRMIEEDRLGSYRRLDGIEETLRRVSIRLAARTGVDFGLGRAVSELVAHRAGLADDFAEFFPALQAEFGG
jgi:acyl carrier protein phosphodiesterase